MEREEILERLVAFHDERVEEEKRGAIRWLRPDYQIPRFAPDTPASELELEDEAPAAPTLAPPAEKVPWPATAVEQLAAITALVARGPVTAKDAVRSFIKPDRKLLARHLETQAMLGEVTEEGGVYGAVRGWGERGGTPVGRTWPGHRFRLGPYRTTSFANRVTPARYRYGHSRQSTTDTRANKNSGWLVT
jgi:hypothetical protein